MRVRFGRGLARHHHIQAGLQKRQQRSELLSQAALDPVANHAVADFLLTEKPACKRALRTCKSTSS